MMSPPLDSATSAFGGGDGVVVVAAVELSKNEQLFDEEEEVADNALVMVVSFLSEEWLRLACDDCFLRWATKKLPRMSSNTS
jgi:hypothetical protein